GSGDGNGPGEAVVVDQPLVIGALGKGAGGDEVVGKGVGHAGEEADFALVVEGSVLVGEVDRGPARVDDPGQVAVGVVQVGRSAAEAGVADLAQHGRWRR